MNYELLLVCVAMFFNVFLMALNSKLLRDDKWVWTMIVSWGISSSQFLVTKAIAVGTDDWSTWFWMSLGASLGVGACHFFYAKFWPTPTDKLIAPSDLKFWVGVDPALTSETEPKSTTAMIGVIIKEFLDSSEPFLWLTLVGSREGDWFIQAMGYQYVVDHGDDIGFSGVMTDERLTALKMYLVAEVGDCINVLDKRT